MSGASLQVVASGWDLGLGGDHFIRLGVCLGARDQYADEAADPAGAEDGDRREGGRAQREDGVGGDDEAWEEEHADHAADEEGVPEGVNSFVELFPKDRFTPYASPLGEV